MCIYLCCTIFMDVLNCFCCSAMYTPKRSIKKGYKINPFERCVANNLVKGKQCKIAWHVDNKKALHVNPKVIDELLGDLKKKIGDLGVRRV